MGFENYVGNRAHPKCSIAKTFIMNIEAMTLCSMYLMGIEIRFKRDERSYDTMLGNEIYGEFDIFKQSARPLRDQH